MARANIPLAGDRMKEIYESAFAGKNRGRYLLSRDQMAELLDVANAHDTTIIKLGEHVLEEYDLCVIQRHHNRFGVVSARKVGAWRKVTKGMMDAYRHSAKRAKPIVDDEEEEEDGDD